MAISTYSALFIGGFLVGITIATVWGGGAPSQRSSLPYRQESCRCSLSSLPRLGGFLRDNLLWRHGSEIVIVLVVIGIIGLLLMSTLVIGVVACALLFSLYFFRNPERRCIAAERDASVLVCPADGKVVEIVDLSNDFVGNQAQRVSIFLSPLDVHVQWMPCAGRVAQVIYHPGEFLVAYAPKSSEVNERNDLCLIASDGTRLVVRQIAGFVARRICCWVGEDEQVMQGMKYGMIRFGSRVDIIMPKSVQLQVAVGQRVFGGHTVLGIK